MTLSDSRLLKLCSCAAWQVEPGQHICTLVATWWLISRSPRKAQKAMSHKREDALPGTYDLACVRGYESVCGLLLMNLEGSISRSTSIGRPTDASIAATNSANSGSSP